MLQIEELITLGTKAMEGTRAMLVALNAKDQPIIDKVAERNNIIALIDKALNLNGHLNGTPIMNATEETEDPQISNEDLINEDIETPRTKRKYVKKKENAKIDAPGKYSAEKLSLHKKILFVLYEAGAVAPAKVYLTEKEINDKIVKKDKLPAGTKINGLSAIISQGVLKHGTILRKDNYSEGKFGYQCS